MLNRIILGIAATLLFSLPLFSQSPKDKMEYSSPYADAWATIDSLEQEGLPKSALEATQALYLRAKEDGQAAERVRALIYRNKYQSQLEEEGLVKAIANMQLEADAASFPVKSVLHSLLGELYKRYLEQNRWRIGARTTTTEERPEDLQLWTIQQLLDETGRQYLLSVADQRLFDISIEEWAAITTPGTPETEGLRPTLYDFLSHRAIDYFSNDQTYLNEPAYKYILRDTLALAGTEAFVNANFSGRDSSAYTLNVLHLMQGLLRLHANNPAARIDLDLKRLEFAYQKLINANKETRYEQALERTIGQYKGTPEVMQAWYALARHYQQLGQQYQPFGDTTHRWKPKAAMELAEKALKAYPDNYWTKPIRALQAQLKAQRLSLQAEQIYLPEQSMLFSLSYQNTDKLHYRLIPLSPEEAYQLEQNRKTENLELLKQKNTRLSGAIDLPDEGDLQEHRTEFALDGQGFGSYALLYATNNNFNEAGKVSVAFFTISELGVLYRRNTNQLLVAHRENGQPLAGVNLQFFTTRYNRDQNQQEFLPHSTAQTDAAGMVALPKAERQYYVVQLSRGADVQILSGGYSQYQPYEADPRSEVTHFFLDRSIYRPGQTIYFKALALTKDAAHIPSVLPNRSITLTFQDANRQEVEVLKLQTNEFGTVQGSFTAPQGGLLGQMSIHSSLGQNTQFFSVEEYKRPKFEVELKPLEGQSELGDTVTLSGLAKAYAGNVIDGAQVAYRVQRSTRFPWSFWWYRMPDTRSMEIANGTTTTGPDGSFSIAFPAIPDETVNPEDRPEFTYTVTVDVTDANGETRSDTRIIRLGYLKLKAEMEMPAQADLADPMMTLQLFAQNLDGNPTEAQGQLTIEALAPPPRALVERYWERPDYYLMEKAEFVQRFPHLPYADEHKKHNWAATGTAFEQAIQTDGQDTLFLNYSGWKVGHYRATLRLKDESGETVESIKHFALFDSKKQQLPAGTVVWGTPVKEGALQPGDTYQHLLGSATAKIPFLIEVEQRNGVKRQEWLKPSSWQRISQSVTENDRGNLFFHVQALQYNRFFQFQQSVQVPWSNKELNISYRTFRDKLLPGSEETWELKISGPEKEAVAAELVAGMYDASLDAYRMHNWYFNPYPMASPRAQWSAQIFSAAYGNSYFYSGRASITQWSRQYPQLNWYNWYSYGRGYPYLATESRSFDDAAGQSDGIVAYSAKIANAEAGARPMAATPPPSPKADSAEGGAPQPTPKPHIRRNLKETVFFFPQLRTDEEGNVIVRFTMNEALTRWKFLAFAHTTSLQYALSEQEVVTQKQLMVQPNAPRFVRQGDRIAFTAKVSNLSESELQGAAQLQLFDAVSMQPIDAVFGNTKQEQPFSIEAGQSQGVSWMLEVPEDFTGAIVHRVTAEAGSYADGEESALPVLTNRTLVTETMPLPIGGAASKTFDFSAMKKAQQSKTLQQHQFTLEFTSNPAWYAVKALPYLMEYPHECTEQIFSRYYANSLASSVANQYPEVQRVFEQWRSTDALLSELEQNQDLKNIILEQTPWVRNAQSETAQRKRIGLLFDLNRMGYEKTEALGKLKERQSSNGGFAWFPGGRESWYITQYLMEGLARLQLLGVEDIAKDQNARNILERGLAFVDEEVADYYTKAMSRKDSLLPNIAIHYLYTRSLTADQELSGTANEAFGFYLKLAQEKWLERNLYEQAMLAVVFQKQDMPEQATKIMKSLRERALYNQEMGMYWKYDYGFYWYQLPIETHAMLIEAFATVAKDEEAVEQLKVWLLKNKQTNHWETTKATASAVYAMLRFGENWLAYDEPVQVSFPKLDNDVYQAQINEAQKNAEAGTGYFKTQWDGKAIQPGFRQIKVDNPNPGIAWGAAYWQYFEDLDKVESFKATPLVMNRTLYREELGDTGPILVIVTPELKLKPGDKLIVRIDIKVDRAMEYVHLQDMRASGLEPVNVLSRYQWQGGLGYYQSTRDASTDFFISYLPKGTYTLEYPLRVSHRGDFTNGMARLQCMYAPEYSSHSAGVRLKVE
ncbi:MAG: alpha-2-macroglobulin family protein [Phaeodactylibacter sp.]|uniref:alpha-2-macroglobulin family protein n=1 Tax=Phaeodactylibacter sp. TaxID=1940289 RepID=UPI0032EE3BDB